MSGPVVRVYSRHLEDMTEKYPDVVMTVAALGVDSFIMDAEIVAVDVGTQRVLPFQTLSTRARKGVQEAEVMWCGMLEHRRT